MKRAIAAVSVAALSAAPAAARFAPRLDVPYRLVTSETRDDGRGARHFSASRTIRFARDDDDPAGYVATVTLDPVAASGDGPEALFGALAAATGERPVRVRLDAAGAATGVDDLPGLWSALRDAIARTAAAHGGPPERSASFLLAGLDAMPAAARLRLFASPVTALVMADADRRRPGTRAITLPALSPGRDAVLTGTESVRVTGSRLAITAEATGTHMQDARTTRTRIVRHQEVDRTTGLIVAGDEERRVDVTIGTTQRTLTTRSTHALSPVVS